MMSTISTRKAPDPGNHGRVSRRHLLKGIGCLAAGTALLPVVGNQGNALAQTAPGGSEAVAPSPTATAQPAATAQLVATPAPSTASAVPQQISNLPKRSEVSPDFTWSLEDIYADLDKGTSFFSPELLAMPDWLVERYLAAEPGLEIYRHALDGLQRQRAHVRSSEVEEVLAQASEMARAAGDARTMLAEADMKFPSILDEKGRTVELTQGRYSQFIISPDRRVRKEAFQGIHRTYQEFRNSFAATYLGQVRADIFAAKTRRYGSCLEAALDGDNVPVAVYHNLIDTVTANLPALHRYLALRKRLLGLPDLHFYDLYVPMVPGVNVEIPYHEATLKVIEGLTPLGEEYVDAMARGINSRWIDVYENAGKTSGAYSWGAYSTHPYVLLNYQGTLNDVLTLAHELGHAMHSYFRTKSQPYVYGDTSIFVAEVASSVNEALVAGYLAKTASDRKQEAYLINQRLEDFRATLYRQTMFAEFELEAHSRTEAGSSLTADKLSAIYGELNGKYFGNMVTMDNEIAIEWARVPHFYSPFYVYKYATGISAAAALAQSILKDGGPAVQAYLNMLKAGSSRYPIDLLKDAGVDMLSPEPIQRALDTFSSMVDRLEKLTA